MSENSKNLDKLSPQMRQLLLLKLKKQKAQKKMIPIQGRGPDNQVFPLSSAQQRLWFLHRYMGPSAVYNIPGKIRFNGPLDLSALTKSLNLIVQRHEILRTTFPSWDEVQEVHPFEAFELQSTDLSHEEYPEVAAEDLMQKAALRSFDLENQFSFYFHLYHLNSETRILFLNMNHIITDGISTGLFLNELKSSYFAFLKGQTPQLPALTVQYADFSAWNRGFLDSNEGKKKVAYWVNQLEDAPLLDLSFDRPRPAKQTWSGALHRFEIAPGNLANVQRISQERKTTPFIVFLALFKVLLYRYTGQTDLVVGVPLANREHAELKNLIGFFVNTLPIRTQLSGNNKFSQVLTDMQKTLSLAQENQDAPFERVVDELKIERDPSHTPIYQVTFNYVSVDEEQDSDSLSMHYEEVFNKTSRFDFSLALARRGKRLLGEMGYNPDLLDASSITRMLGHYENLIQGLPGTVEKTLSELPMLDGKELELLSAGRLASLDPKEETLPDYEGAQAIHNIFEEQVRRCPNRIALSFQGKNTSYDDLNRVANRVAWALMRLGVTKESRVGLCLERTPRILIGILGVLKAGAVYVPIDPHYPSERLSFIARDSGMKLVLAQKDFASGFPDHLVVDIDRLETNEEDEKNPMVEVHDDNAAYIIYTSGSTGQPKGVVIPHGNVIRLFSSTWSRFQFNETDVWTLFHSYAFDFTVWEIWGSLFHGARLAIVPYLISRTPEAFHQLLYKEGVTVLCQSPSAFRQLILTDQESDIRLDDLRYVIFGAEALELSSLTPWYNKYRDSVSLVNMYGITETTVHVTWRPIELHEQGAASPVGKAISDLTIHILDEQGHLVPIGVPGEIYVGGPGLARAYHNQAGITAQRFPPNPFSIMPGKRLYRTGDKAQYLPDGSLAFLGRVDDQVKIRGFRIEPGEIQAALLELPSVRDALVLAQSHEEGDLVLVAYVIPKGEDKPSVSALREDLSKTLPDYMVPNLFCFLDSFPLTSHGKLDRKSLPQVSEIANLDTERATLPETATESILAAVWSEILGVSHVGRDANYFTLGGDSIRAIRVLGKSREKGLEFTLQDLFAYPTLKSLSRVIDRARAVTPETGSCKPFSLISKEVRNLLPDHIEDAYPMAHLQLGMLYEMKAQTTGPLAYHDVASFIFEGVLDRDAFQESLNRLCDRHAIFRTSLHVSQYGEPLQLVHEGFRLTLGWVDLRSLPPGERQLKIKQFLKDEAANGFEPDEPGLVRYTVHQLEEQRFHFTQTLCHPILDGWSTSSSMAELFEVHDKILKEGDPAALPPLSLAYRDFIHLEQEAVQSEAVATFWENHLNGFTPRKISRLPIKDDPNNPDETNEVLWQVPIERVIRLKDAARAAGVPLKSLFLAAHYKVMSMLYGSNDIVAGLQVNGRHEETDGDKVLGLFLNAVPARLRLEHGSWKELMQAAFRMEWEILPYRRYPTAVIQANYETPIFETFFNYVSFHSIEHFFEEGKYKPLEDTEYSEPTHFPFFHGFNVDPVQGGLTVVLQSIYKDISRERLEACRCYYDNIFKAMEAESLGDPCLPHHYSPLMTNTEWERVLVNWNRTGRKWGRPDNLLDLIDERVVEHPQKTALVCQGISMSYEKLDYEAGRAAFRLKELDVGPDQLVGLCLNRSFEMVVGILGILKAGAAYVPLDPTNPPARLKTITEDAGINVILTSCEFKQNKFIAQALNVVYLDEPLPAQTFRCPSPSGLRAAYMIYTSGSTGKPKGVINSHGAIVNRLLWKADYLDITEDDRILQKTPFTFDVSVWEIFLPLITGAVMVIAEPEQHKDVAYLSVLMIEESISVVHFVPSLLTPFLAQRGLEQIAQLRHVICSGEALPHGLVEAFQNRMDARLHNLYGPTEAAVDVTAQDTAIKAWPGMVPIGKPIANTDLYILDKDLMPSIIGSPGELYIGGMPLARGYHQRPSLTSERFVPNPFGQNPGLRIYKTGDSARWLPDGRIQYLGRLDTQIKLRGFRIELGEIQATLASHPGVRQNAVLVRADNQGRRTIVGYIVPDATRPPSIDELKKHLMASLPEYMIPSNFAFLDAFPMTRHGKLDEKALPDIQTLREATQKQYLPPETETERILAEIWGNALGLEKISRDAHFFNLGGDSIVSLRVVAQAEARGLNFSIAQLHQHSTLMDLAREMDMGMESDKLPDPISDFQLISEKTRKMLPPEIVDAYPMSRSQLGMIYHMEMDPELKPYFNVDCCLFKGYIEETAFREAARIVVQRHPVLRTSFNLTKYEEPLQLVAETAQLKIHWEDLRGLDPKEQDKMIRARFEEEVNNPFDVSQSPLLRYAIQVISDTHFQLTLVEHHALVDGWSFNSLLAELMDTTFSIMDGSDIVEPTLPKVAYRDFVYQEQLIVRSEKARAFWKEYLLNLSRLKLPRWLNPPKTEQVPVLKEVVKPFSATQVAVLEDLAKSVGASIKSVLLAAHVKVLSHLSNQDDIITSVITTGRPEMEGGDRIYGLFFNTMPFRVRIKPGGWQDLVRQVFESERVTIPFRRVPVAAIQEEYGKEPLFQTMFNYINFHVLKKVMASGRLTFIRKDHSKDPTHFPLRTDFSQDPITREIYLVLQSTDPGITIQNLERVSNYYIKTLRALASAQESPEIGSCHHHFQMCSRSEQVSLLKAFEQTSRVVMRTPLPNRLEALAQEIGEAVAVKDGIDQTTYRDLVAKMRCLSVVLKNHGVNPGDVVGVCLHQPAALDACLGIWAARAVCLTLSPESDERIIREQLLKVGAKVVLATEDFHMLRECNVPILRYDELSIEGEEHPLVETHIHDGAWLSFSGKGSVSGACYSHNDLSLLLEDLAERKILREGETMLSVPPNAYENGGLEVFLPLLKGGAVAFMDRNSACNPDLLGQQMNNAGASVLAAPPLIPLLLLEGGWDPSGCRLICLGGNPEGEEISGLIDYNVAFHHLYDPAQTTVYSVAVESGQRAKKGRTTCSSSFLVLGQQLQLIPDGVIGDLWQAGEALPSYLAMRPSLTAIHLIPNPFSKNPGERLFRTNAKAEILEDGSMELTSLSQKSHPIKSEAPETEGQRDLAAIIGNLLDIPEIGIHDLFHQMGMNFRLAVRLHGRIAEEFGIHLPLNAIFDHPTISRLDEIIMVAQIGKVDQDQLEDLLLEVGDLRDDDLLNLLGKDDL